MHVRPATVDDAEAIETIRIRGWQTAYRHVFPPDQLDAMIVDVTRWRESLAGPWDQACYVCEDGGRVVGWVTIGDDELKGMYVDPDAWSRGAGAALMARAESDLARTCDRAILHVLEANERARRFYERQGWAHDGTRGVHTRFGVDAPVVRYAKQLSRDTGG